MIQTDAEQCCCHSRIRIGEQRLLAARLLAMPRAFPSEQLMLCGIMVGVEDNLFVFDETREGHWDVLLLINTYKHIHAHTRTLWLLLYGSKQAKCLSCAATVGNSLLLRPRALQERAGALAVCKAPRAFLYIQHYRISRVCQ